MDQIHFRFFFRNRRKYFPSPPPFSFLMIYSFIYTYLDSRYLYSNWIGYVYIYIYTFEEIRKKLNYSNKIYE